MTTQIISSDDVFDFLGESTPTASERALMDMVRPMAENDVRNYVGYTITQATYTHFLPGDDIGGFADESLDVVNNRVAFDYSDGTDKLYVPERPIRSITSIYKDAAAYYGQGSSDFGSSTLLTAGTDYYLEYLTSGTSWSGCIRLVAGAWPSRSGTVKVTYVAGLTAAELSGSTYCRGPRGGDVTSLKRAAMICAAAAFKQGGGVANGPIVSERLADYAVTYGKSIESLHGFKVALPDSVKESLEPFRRFAL